MERYHKIKPLSYLELIYFKLAIIKFKYLLIVRKMSCLFEALISIDKPQEAQDQSFEQILQNLNQVNIQNQENLNNIQSINPEIQNMNFIIEELQQIDLEDQFEFQERRNILVKQVKETILAYIWFIQKFINIFDFNLELILKILQFYEELMKLLKEKIIALQNEQEINIVNLIKQVQFFKRLNNFYLPLFSQIKNFTGKLQKYNEKLAVLQISENPVSIRQGEIFYQNQNISNLEDQISSSSYKLFCIQQANSFFENSKKIKIINTIRILSEFLKLNSNFADVYNEKGNQNYIFKELYYNQIIIFIRIMELERYDDAGKCVDQAIRINPNCYQFYNNKGDILNMININYLIRRLNKDDDAIQYYNKAINKNPNDYYAYHQIDRNEEAIKYLDQAININPQNTNSYEYKYWSLHLLNSESFRIKQLKRYDEAVKVSDQFIKLEPDFSWHYYRKGEALNYILCKYDSQRKWEIILKLLIVLIKLFNSAIIHIFKKINKKFQQTNLKYNKIIKLGRNEEAQQLQQRIDELKKKGR